MESVPRPERDAVETFICPKCGHPTTYEPARCPAIGREEQYEGEAHWCVYLILKCANCGQEERQFRERSKIL
jgi:predicted RNA-binding Zn-ribbon protein involved in translation (DUF1610 family)